MFPKNKSKGYDFIQTCLHLHVILQNIQTKDYIF